MKLSLQGYLDSLRGKRVAVIGIGVSNTPLIKTLCKAGINVTACDKNTREAFGSLADELESLGASLKLGETYLDDLDQDVIFRSPPSRAMRARSYLSMMAGAPLWTKFPLITTTR